MIHLDDAIERMRDSLSLHDVFVSKAAATLSDGFDPKQSNEQLGFQVRFKAMEEAQSIEAFNEQDPAEKVTIIRYRVDTGVRFVPISEKENKASTKVVAEIVATFCADYVVRDPSILNDDSVSAFADNVIYHVWPYWREFVQTSANRLRLPPAVLPPFKLNRRETPNAPAANESRPKVELPPKEAKASSKRKRTTK